ncbi:hypothetical protein YDYSY3_20260 [Paenibacillus chitinolyticus]|uniref:phosphoribosyltransferase family protein n=1 Tax=Paenibacillus chitinolyticus TaxID=79263 RepID=UPI0026E4D88A|nr:phosphoribosyltransferase family protein [Paenibacillus chitinolyticus]GKS11026.1 hypothetical protein YDYSY3_20260 [Paenibacillus chitinolyticus]
MYNIIGDLQVTIEITRNELNLPLDTFFKMAARINKKRSFLFVSKVLGKHLAVNPNVALLSGATLGILLQNHLGGPQPHCLQDLVQAFDNEAQAENMYKSIKSAPLRVSEPTLFIGFAETATALGHSMFDIFSGPTKFLHTTRDIVNELEPILKFEEEHSHATAHRCYALNETLFEGNEPVILVDDEITTGKTALNIIQDLQQKHPRSRYVVASLLDWRSEQDIQRFHQTEQELGITITCLSLIQGQISVAGTSIELNADKTRTSSNPQFQLKRHHVGHFFHKLPFSSRNSLNNNNHIPFLKLTGRFGMNGEDTCELDQQVAECAKFLKSCRIGQKTLCVGTGEFMYIPMRIAAEMGSGVSYQSSTRSPIHPNNEPSYAIHNVYRFDSPDDSKIPNFFYNVSKDMYDEIFVFIEREIDENNLASFLDALESTAVPAVHIVHF